MAIIIWCLYTGKLPFDSIRDRLDIDEMEETVKEGGTVDIMAVEKEGVRGWTEDILKASGAHIPKIKWFPNGCVCRISF